MRSAPQSVKRSPRPSEFSLECAVEDGGQQRVEFGGGLGSQPFQRLHLSLEAVELRNHRALFSKGNAMGKWRVRRQKSLSGLGFGVQRYHPDLCHFADRHRYFFRCHELVNAGYNCRPDVKRIEGFHVIFRRHGDCLLGQLR